MPSRLVPLKKLRLEEISISPRSIQAASEVSGTAAAGLYQTQRARRAAIWGELSGGPLMCIRTNRDHANHLSGSSPPPSMIALIVPSGRMTASMIRNNYLLSGEGIP